MRIRHAYPVATDPRDHLTCIVSHCSAHRASVSNARYEQDEVPTIDWDGLDIVVRIEEVECPGLGATFNRDGPDEGWCRRIWGVSTRTSE